MKLPLVRSFFFLHKSPYVVQVQDFWFAYFFLEIFKIIGWCAAGFALLNLPKGKSLGRSKPATSSYAQALQHTVWDSYQGWAKLVLIALERYSVELKRLTFNFR